MPLRIIALTLTVIFLALAASVVHAAPNLAVWPVDSMQKVFKDDVPPVPPAEVIVEAARGEVVSAQVVVRSTDPLERLTCRVSPPALQTQVMPMPLVRYEGYVPVRNKKPPNTLRPRPCDYPDPLLDTPPAVIPAGTAQPIWLTLKIPADAAPGLYAGQVQVDAVANGAARQASVPLRVRVYAARLPAARTLKVSNWAWFDTLKVTQLCGVDALYTEPFWRLMEAVAADMAAHRQNVIFTPVTAWTWGKDDADAAEDLITGTVDAQGRLAFDFTRFDRWVNIFQAAGVDGLIEASPLTKRSRTDREYKSVVWMIENGKVVRRRIPSVDPAYGQYLAVYLTALQAHLVQRGWIDRYAQHILDEPNGERRPTYLQVSGWVKQYAPRIKRLDAIQMPDLAGAIDIWVPTWNGLTHNLAVYKDRQVVGSELWFYTMGRPVEYPLTQVRLYQWANYATGTTGYLHWGYNWWVRSQDPLAGKWTLAPGDEWIVYPKPGGVLDSIRYEAMLEGIQDYELLQQLSQRDQQAADAIARKLVLFNGDAPTGAFDDSIDALRSARRELLEALSK